ncbi:MAG TPA: hypothetical protein VFS13_14160 [Steroidobacteraceae bacterium]|jgi:hypothetical protein|nr:hypothetical protein [Steroidobacteraceae bacterium]
MFIVGLATEFMVKFPRAGAGEFRRAGSQFPQSGTYSDGGAAAMRTRGPRRSLLCALYLGADDFVAGMPALAGDLQPAGLHWNRAGKVASLVFSLLVIATLRLSSEAVGLKFECGELVSAFCSSPARPTRKL